MSTEETYLTSWDAVDRLVRFVAHMKGHANWWCTNVDWRTEGVYEVTFAKGPGLAWVKVKAFRTMREVLDMIDRTEPSEKGGTAG